MPFLAPARPSNEESRLRALQAAKILDTTHDQEFDELLRLACSLCDTPMGTITLVDRDRQWFKARIGIDVDETPRDLSFCGHTILGTETMQVPDTTVDDRFAEHPLVIGDPYIRFYAGAPLATPEGLNLGTICVIDKKPRTLSDNQRQMLEILAKHVVSRIRAHTQGAIADERELRMSRKLFFAFMDNCPIVGILKDAEGRMVWYNRLCAERFGVDREEWLGKTDAERWPPERALEARTRDMVVLNGGRLVETYEPEVSLDGTRRYWSTYRFPFVDPDGERFVASLAIDVTRASVAEAEVAHYQRELEAANAQLHELSITDALTGVKNRRAFDERVQHEFALAVRHNLPLSLMMLDADHFKSFNDTFGHAEGDVMLRSMAATIQSSVRNTDMVARYGGEEFAVILPNTNQEEAKLLAERICRAVETMKSPKRKMTVSIGIASKTPELVNREHFFSLADEALYCAKNKGRNCISVAGER
jgi:diguanylate cyclase (GGDEF)-like protein/PAS domain S-box-containing protein